MLHLLSSPSALRPLPLLVFLHGYGERRRAARPVAGDVWGRHAEPVRAQRAPEQPVWLSAGELARSQRRAFVKALGLVEHGERVWADDGENHVGCARVAYGDERIYRWLRSSRP